MFEVLKFIFKVTADFIKMLFTIDVGNGINLGLVLCVLFIFLPIFLKLVNFLKGTMLDEVDEAYDFINRNNKKKDRDK